MTEFYGKGVSAGVAVARLAWYKRANESRQMSVGSPAKEWQKFNLAREKVVEFLGGLAEKARSEGGEEIASLFETHQMMAEDLDFEDAVSEAVNAGVSASDAVRSAGENLASVLASSEDEYMRERAADIRDVASRIAGVLGGGELSGGVSIPNEPFILCSDDLSPSETMQLDKHNLRGILLSEGSTTGHTSILSKMLGIPLIILIGDKLDASLEGKTAAIDGGEGRVVAEPSEEILFLYNKKLEENESDKKALEAFRGRPTETKLGRKIKLYCNIGSPSDADAVITHDGEGIGLYRSEFLYLQGDDYPTEKVQFEAYRAVAEKMAGKEVIIRTCDIGADKQIGYFDLPHEENPALGMRAVRICLERTEMFKTQLRALYRASAYGNINIMFPMIASVWELRECKALCERVRMELEAENVPFSRAVKLGIMIETPAAVVVSDELAKEADFFSCGTNDLTQYVLACDRQNEKLGRHYDAHHPALLRMLAMTARNASEAGIPIGICGELASDTALTEFFISIGISELSVSPSQVLPLRRKISELD